MSSHPNPSMKVEMNWVPEAVHVCMSNPMILKQYHRTSTNADNFMRPFLAKMSCCFPTPTICKITKFFQKKHDYSFSPLAHILINNKSRIIFPIPFLATPSSPGQE